jgi:hypothetical protein
MFSHCPSFFFFFGHGIYLSCVSSLPWKLGSFCSGHPL